MPCKALTFSHDFLYNVSEKQKSKSEKLESKDKEIGKKALMETVGRAKRHREPGLVETWCK